ncbi:MAG: endonuclease domain-containing protein [Phenylobacterium sp.]|uniref:endonuclease domain-containing protein n=1 Tax=Phenylobacterium sp. TaxID=1871053 RepID=UPI001A6297A5|nr:DUF559 domain-containing protein [Phenylobacterium sp.]MBL8771406.1 endonuclease domain-containing protein [Phenylobacterium sp.]
MRPEIERARRLRADMSRPEVILWSRLKRLRGEGYHFRRQAPFRGFFLDFVCYSRRLVVEVDGGQHGEEPQAAHDAMRDAILRRHGFTVLRVPTGAVRSNMIGVMESIVAHLQAAPLAHGRTRRASPDATGASPP